MRLSISMTKGVALAIAAAALTLGFMGQAKAEPDFGDSGSGYSGPGGPGGADPQFDFTYSDGANSAFGTLSASALGGGDFLATSGSLTVTAGADAGTYSLFPGGPGQTTSPSGAFYYDDVVYPGSNPFIDNDGLLFTGNGLEINIFSSGSSNYSFYSYNGSSYNVASGPPFGFANGGSASLSAVPEPAGLTLLGFGAVLLLGYAGFRRRKALAARA